tara:strand:- start:3932 stop:6037 length:2106 start_codon:yes stop_codon:yes gene_type:complete
MALTVPYAILVTKDDTLTTSLAKTPSLYSTVVSGNINFFAQTGTDILERQSIVGIYDSMWALLLSKWFDYDGFTAGTHHLIATTSSYGGGTDPEITLVEQTSDDVTVAAGDLMISIAKDFLTGYDKGASTFGEVAAGIAINTFLSSTINPDNSYPANTTFFGSGGVDNTDAGRGASPSLPFLTFDYAHENTLSTQTVGANSGTYETATYFEPPANDGRNLSSWQPRTAIFKAIAGATTRVIRLGTTYTQPNYGGDRLIFSGMKIDADGISARCIDVAAGAGSGSELAEFNVLFQNVEFIDPVDHGIKLFDGSLDFTVDGCDFSYESKKAVIASTGSAIGSTGDCTVTITNNTIDCTTPSSSDGTLVAACDAEAAAERGNFDYVFSGNAVTVDVDASIATDYTVLKLERADTITVENNSITATTTTFANDFIGMSPASDATTNIIGNALLKNNDLDTDAASGIGIGIGLDTDAGDYSNVQIGLIDDNIVTGRYSATNTLVAYLLGYTDNTSGAGSIGDRLRAKDNIAVNAYIGYKVYYSEAAYTNVVEHNLAYDCYGASYYDEDSDGSTIQRNRAFVTTDTTQRTLGILHASDSSSPTFANNTVVVQSSDFTGVNALARCPAAGSTSASFVSNNYIIPDTIPTTANLFDIAGTPSTEAQWFALFPADGQDGTITRLPQADIDAMCDAAEAEVVSKLGHAIPT